MGLLFWHLSNATSLILLATPVSLSSSFFHTTLYLELLGSHYTTIMSLDSHRAFSRGRDDPFALASSIEGSRVQWKPPAGHILSAFGVPDFPDLHSIPGIILNGLLGENDEENDARGDMNLEIWQAARKEHNGRCLKSGLLKDYPKPQPYLVVQTGAQMNVQKDPKGKGKGHMESERDGVAQVVVKQGTSSFSWEGHH
jgi:hypothetical protein